MKGTSDLIKWIDETRLVRSSQADVDTGGIDGFMSKAGSQGQQIHAIFITSGGIRMAEGMCREAFIHAKGIPEDQDLTLDPLFVHGPVEPALLCKEPFPGTRLRGEGIPVLQDHLPDALGKRDITVLPIF